MPKNKPKYKKAGAKSGTGAPAAEKGKKQPKGASKGRTAAPARGGGRPRSTAAAAATAKPAAAKDAPARRLRFVTPAARQGLARLGASAGQSWQRLMIRLRLRGSVKPGDAGAAAGTGRARGTTGGTRKAVGPRPLKRAPGVQTPGAWGSLTRRCRGLIQSPWLQNLYRQAITFDGMMAVLLAIMLFYPPFFRGLFFASELLPTHMLTAAVFALFAFYKLTRRELSFFNGPLDYAVFVLLGLYITSSINAWNTRDAIAAVLKMANYAAVYWLLAYSVRSLSAVRGYLGVLLASGAGVSLLGLGAAIGTFSYKDAFVDGRIFGSLQYPNTTASFLTAINLFGLYLWDESRNKFLGALLAAANYLLFLTILGTQSRGALVIYPIALVILLLGLTGRQRWRVLGCFAVQLVASLAVYGQVMARTGGQAQLQGWLWVLAGAALASVLYLAWQYLASRRQSGALPLKAGARKRHLQPWVVPAAVVLAVAVLGAAGFGLWRERGTVAAIASQITLQAEQQPLIARLKTVSWSDINIQERLVMSRDALKIMAASPANALLGAGGGGWNASYHMYQSYLYFTTEAHNHFMQVGVETGFPGLLTFLLIWIFFIAAAWRLYRQVRPDGKTDPGAGEPGAALPATAWVILSSAVALGIHSAMDFNLSLGAVALLLWALFGLIRGLDRLYGPEAAARAAAAEAAAARDRRGRSRYKKNETVAWKMPSSIQGLIVGALTAVVFFWSLNLLIGIQYAQAAGTAASGNRVDEAVSNMEQAIGHDTWNTEFRSTLALFYRYQIQVLEISQDPASQDPNAIQDFRNERAALFNKALDVLQKAVKEDRGGDASLRMLYAQMLFNAGFVDEGVNQLEQARALVPLAKQSYEALSQGYFVAGRLYLEQAEQPLEGTAEQDVQEARQRGQEILQQALGAPKQIQDLMAGIPQAVQDMWTARGEPLLEATPQVYQNAGMAGVLLGRYQEADGYLEAALEDENLKATTLLWQGISLQQQQKDAEGQNLIDEALKLDQSLSEELPVIRALLPE